MTTLRTKPLMTTTPFAGMDPKTKLSPMRPFNPHGSDCKGHKMSFLEDPMDTGEDRLLMLKIVNQYFPEE